MTVGGELHEVGRCHECGASYYQAEEIGQACEIQYCRGVVKPSAAAHRTEVNARLRALGDGTRGVGF